MLFRGVTQLGRVLGLGPRCRRFKSCHLDQIRKAPYRSLSYLVKCDSLQTCGRCGADKKKITFKYCKSQKEKQKSCTKLSIVAFSRVRPAKRCSTSKRLAKPNAKEPKGSFLLTEVMRSCQSKIERIASQQTLCQNNDLFRYFYQKT